LPQNPETAQENQYDLGMLAIENKRRRKPAPKKVPKE